MQKIIPVAMLALTAFVLIGANANMAALAAKKADTVVDNAKAIVVTTSQGTTIFNINSVKGDKGDPGAPGKDGVNGTNGKDGQNGAPGRDGINGTNGTNGLNGKDGRDGVNGTNGKDGVSTICIVQGNQTCGLTPTPVPVPPTNTTGNVTNAHK